MLDSFALDEKLNCMKYRTLCEIPEEIVEKYEGSKHEDLQKIKDQFVIVNLLCDGEKTEKIVCVTEENGIKLELRGLGIQSLRQIEGLEKLVYLKYLDLSHNELECIKELQEMDNLTTLILSDNKISDVTPLERLTQLTGLTINDNKIEDISPIGNLENLIVLGLSRNQIEDVTPLAFLEKLKVLYLEGNHIENVAPLKHLTRLTDLWLSDNQIADIEPLLELGSLYYIKLKGNPLPCIDEEDELCGAGGIIKKIWQKQREGEAKLKLFTKWLETGELSEKTPEVGNREISPEQKKENWEKISKIKNPQIKKWGVFLKKCEVIWDCIEFGGYPQEKIKQVTRMAGRLGEKENFIRQPIRWRVLDIRDGIAYLLADKILDVKKYEKLMDWDENWLNGDREGDFYKTAFSENEKEAILGTLNKNKINLLTQYEIADKNRENYGLFPVYSQKIKSQGKDCKLVRKLMMENEFSKAYTDYAESKGLWKRTVNHGKGVSGQGAWWLANKVAVNEWGEIVEGQSLSENEWAVGVRPVIKVDLKKMDKIVLSGTAVAVKH